MKLHWLRRHKFLVFTVAIAIGFVILASIPLQQSGESLRLWFKSLGFWAFPVFVLLYVTISIFALPNVALMLIAGAIFGLIQAIISVSIADTLAAIACYGIGRTFARQRIKKWLKQYPNLLQLDVALHKKGWKIILLSRLSPIIPSNVLNYGFSFTKVNFWQYLFFTWLGMLPVIGFYVYLGYFGGNLLNRQPTPQSLAWQTIGIVATVVAAFYVTRLIKKTLFNAETSLPKSRSQAKCGK